MKKKDVKVHTISAERMAEIRRRTIIASAGASTRLAGSKMTDKQVEELMHQMGK